MSPNSGSKSKGLESLTLRVRVSTTIYISTTIYMSTSIYMSTTIYISTTIHISTREPQFTYVKGDPTDSKVVLCEAILGKESIKVMTDI